jgi:hypothetical protein
MEEISDSSRVLIVDTGSVSLVHKISIYLSLLEALAWTQLDKLSFQKKERLFDSSLIRLHSHFFKGILSMQGRFLLTTKSTLCCPFFQHYWLLNVLTLGDFWCRRTAFACLPAYNPAQSSGFHWTRLSQIHSLETDTRLWNKELDRRLVNRISTFETISSFFFKEGPISWVVFYAMN